MLLTTGLGRVSAHHAIPNENRYNASITENKHHACFKLPISRPNMYTCAIGTMIIASISTKFATGVGFSNGCALFTPYQPPPFVKSCLQDSKDATGPTGRLWVSTFWSTITGLPLSSLTGLPLSSVL